MSDSHPQKPVESHVLVAVVTTSGRWPHSGFEKVASHQPVEEELRRALRELHIVGATDWLATVKDRDIDPHKSYVDNGLTGEVTIHYGPRAGGGGCA